VVLLLWAPIWLYIFHFRNKSPDLIFPVINKCCRYNDKGGKTCWGNIEKCQRDMILICFAGISVSLFNWRRASVWIVFPSPMSSARHPPRSDDCSQWSQRSPSTWYSLIWQFNPAGFGRTGSFSGTRSFSRCLNPSEPSEMKISERIGKCCLWILMESSWSFPNSKMPLYFVNHSPGRIAVVLSGSSNSLMPSRMFLLKRTKGKIPFTYSYRCLYIEPVIILPVDNINIYRLEIIVPVEIFSCQGESGPLADYRSFCWLLQPHFEDLRLLQVSSCK